MMGYVLLGVCIAAMITLTAYGRHRRMTGQYFWRKVMAVWIMLLAVIVVALLPLKITSDSTNLSNLDLIIVADLTQSMNALDGRDGGDRTRIDDMRDDIKQIANDHVGASIGLYTFDDHDGVYLPLTVGSDDVLDAADTLYTDAAWNSIPEIMPYTEVLSNVAGYVQAQRDRDPTRERAVVFMSDFEIYNGQETESDILSAARKVNSAGASLTTVVYGRTDPVKMLRTTYDYINSEYIPGYKSESGNDDEYSKYIQDNYKTVFSTANPELGERIAKEAGGRTVQATADQQGVKSVVDAAITGARKFSRQNEQTVAIRQNLFYVIPAVALFAGLVGAEIAQMPRVIRRLQRRGATK